MSDPLERLKTALADHYAVERELGRGGMAVVYLAHDLKHERPVALKVLRPELTAALGTERFLQEIRIAANLHHPHVLPLYDSGEADGFLYYVMPYVEGEPLRDRLDREKQLAIDDALQVAREVADALSYAHTHGVIHRDIKPENILLESGHAVVADFGIARAVDAAGGEHLTETGVAVGTPAYMSPEQAAGERELDGRSDLYSLGCVLHEMLAGQPPFTGPTVESLVRQHLSAEPPSVTAIRPSVPGWVAVALERSLAKTPADRFNPVAQFGEAITPRTTLTTETTPAAARSGLPRWFLSGLIATAVLVTVLVWVNSSEPLTITLSNRRQITRAPGIEWDPAINPDGSAVLYTAGPAADRHVFLQDLSGVRPFPLTINRPGWQQRPRWTSDGSFVVFTEGRPDSGVASLLVPRLGGPARRLRAGETWDVRNGRIAYRRHDSVLVRAVDGGAETFVALADERTHSIVFSPDGASVAYVQGNAHSMNPGTLGNVAASAIWIGHLAGGPPVRVTDDTTLNVSPAWMPDGRHLLFVSNRDGPRDIYMVRLDRHGRPESGPTQVIGGLSPHSISLSGDGSTIAYSSFTARQNIWEVAIPATGSVSISGAIPVTEGNQVIEFHGLSKDRRRLAFDANLHGTQDIYVMPLEGPREPRRITTDPSDDTHPDFSPDGREIVFYSHRTGTRDIFLISTDGTDEVQLTRGPDQDLHPSFSPDGLRLAFSRQTPSGARDIYVMSRESLDGEWSAPKALSRNPWAMYGRWSPDGERISYCRIGMSQVWTVTLDGQESLLFDGQASGLTDVMWPDWSLDGRHIYFTANDSTGVGGLYVVPVEGGRAREVVRFDGPARAVGILFAFTLADDRVYFTISEYESDIWVADVEVER